MDPKIFFPERGGGQRRGKKVCEGCPVREECRDYARRTNTHYGIWGGEVLKRWGDSIEASPSADAGPDPDAPVQHATQFTGLPPGGAKLPLIPPD